VALVAAHLVQLRLKLVDVVKAGMHDRLLFIDRAKLLHFLDMQRSFEEVAGRERKFQRQVVLNYRADTSNRLFALRHRFGRVHVFFDAEQHGDATIQEGTAVLDLFELDKQVVGVNYCSLHEAHVLRVAVAQHVELQGRAALALEISDRAK
jgi:hypothetical protein